jgi:hypothetical protein
MYSGLEPIIDKLLTELAANLPAEIVTRAALLPVLPMPAPAAAEYTFGERQIHTTYPAVEIFPVTTPIDKDNNESLTLWHNVGIAIFARAPKEENLTRLLLRYADAVIQVIANRRAAGAFNGLFSLDMNEQTLDWSPTRVAQRTLLERDVMFAVRCMKTESRS